MTTGENKASQRWLLFTLIWNNAKPAADNSLNKCAIVFIIEECQRTKMIYKVEQLMTDDLFGM